eukprot:scaffold867_cov317-Pavlova_lutheri.AAC.31
MVPEKEREPFVRNTFDLLLASDHKACYTSRSYWFFAAVEQRLGQRCFHDVVRNFHKCGLKAVLHTGGVHDFKCICIEAKPN